MPAAKAQALVQGLMIFHADPHADGETLERLSLWALTQYSPIVAMDPPDGIVMDTEGADHLQRGEERMLKVKLPITCAVRWLVPRLARFLGLHPEISVQITTSHERVDFRREDIDVAIHYGQRADKGLASQTLFNEVLVPICSPKLLRKPPALRSPRDLAHHVLLHSIRRTV